MNFSRFACPTSSMFHLGETMRDVDPMLRWIADRFDLGADWRAADIGAHVGAVTLCMLQHFPRVGLVHAYEPHPQVAAMLRGNTQHVRSQVEVHEAAVVAHDHTRANLFERGVSLLGSSLVMLDRRHQSISVDATSIRNLPAGIRVWKIDSEGNEGDLVTAMRDQDIADAWAFIIETHSRADAEKVRRRLSPAFEMVRAVEHPRFPYRNELWSR